IGAPAGWRQSRAGRRSGTRHGGVWWQYRQPARGLRAAVERLARGRCRRVLATVHRRRGATARRQRPPSGLGGYNGGSPATASANAASGNPLSATPIAADCSVIISATLLPKLKKPAIRPAFSLSPMDRPLTRVA